MEAQTAQVATGQELPAITRSLTAPDPRLVMAISKEVIDELTTSKDISRIELCSLLYGVVKATLREIVKEVGTSKRAFIVFAYYISCYKEILKFISEKTHHELILFGSATTSVFDLIIIHPKDSTVRAMITLAGESLRETMTDMYAINPDFVGPDFILPFANIANITSSLRSYTREAVVIKNKPYFVWVKDTLYSVYNAMVAGDAEKFMKIMNAPMTHSIIGQIISQQNVIRTK